ncbi:chaplin [Streptomyces venezuelae]
MRQALSKGMLSAAAATSILSLSGAHAFAAGEANGQAADSPGFLSGNNVQAPVEVPVNVCGNSANGVGVGNPAFGNSCGSTSHSHSHSHSGPQAPRGAPSAPKAASHTTDDDAARPAGPTGTTGSSTGSAAVGDAAHSPGVLAGNNAKAPADVPVKACGNTVDVVAALSPAMGNGCDAEAGTPHHQQPPSGTVPPAEHAPEAPEADPRAMPPGHPDAPKHSRVSSSTTPDHAPHGGRESRPVHAASVQGDRLAATGADDELLGAAGASAALLLGGAILYRRGMASSRR